VRLRAALLAACAERPLGEVSVADVVRRAGVGRATFYLHYPDLDALAVDACAQLVREAVDALHDFPTPPDPATPPAALVAFFGSVEQHGGLYRGLLRAGGGGPLGGLLHTELRERSKAERRARGFAGPTEDVMASAVAAAFTGVLADWLHGRVPGAPRDVAADTWRLLVTLHRAF
jgi:AcrR family transcriptional regulator